MEGGQRQGGRGGEGGGDRRHGFNEGSPLLPSAAVVLSRGGAEKELEGGVGIDVVRIVVSLLLVLVLLMLPVVALGGGAEKEMMGGAGVVGICVGIGGGGARRWRGAWGWREVGGGGRQGRGGVGGRAYPRKTRALVSRRGSNRGGKRHNLAPSSGSVSGPLYPCPHFG